MQAVEDFIRSIQGWVWGPLAWTVLLGGGIFLSIRFKGF